MGKCIEESESDKKIVNRKKRENEKSKVGRYGNQGAVL